MKTSADDSLRIHHPYLFQCSIVVKLRNSCAVLDHDEVVLRELDGAHTTRWIVRQRAAHAGPL